MSCYLLYKEDDLLGIGRGVPISLVQHFHHFAFGSKGANGIDSFLREFFVGFNIIVDCHGVTVAGKSLYRKGGINQGIALCESVSLCADKDGIFA